MRILGGKIFTAGQWQQQDLAITRGKLADCTAAEEAGPQLRADGLYILPGFLELHTHGGAGVDVNGADEGQLRQLCLFFAQHGVTGWLCSILTDTPEQTSRCIQVARRIIEAPSPGARLLGIHLEGPCLSPVYRGAMPEALLCPRVDLELLEGYQRQAGGHIRYLTLSPELPGAAQSIPALEHLGIRVALGHSGADYAQTWACIAAGARAGTHVGNAMRLFHQHDPGIFGAILESDLYCEAICDGRHLHPASVRLYHKVKGNQRMLAVTDSIMAAGLPDGHYHLGVNPVLVEQGDAKLPDGTRAGSTLTMDAALRNIMAFTGLPLEEAAQWMTANPAQLMGWQSKGRIAPGMDADLVLLDENFRVRACIVAGEQVAGAPLPQASMSST